MDVHANVDPECLAIERTFANRELAELAALNPTKPRWQAQKSFRLAAAHLSEGNPKLAGPIIRLGLEAVNEQLRSSPEDVELLLLGVMLDGQAVLVNRWRFLHNGLRGFRRLKQARAVAPDNPRLLLIEGTARMILPGVLGGDRAKAISYFERGLNTRPLCADGQWAQIDLLTWLGRAYLEIGEPDSAARAFAAARQLDPANHWLATELAGRGYRWEQPQPPR